MSVNFDEVIIDIEKIRDYCLNLDHTAGKHKAVVFKEKATAKIILIAFLNFSIIPSS